MYFKEFRSKHITATLQNPQCFSQLLHENCGMLEEGPFFGQANKILAYFHNPFFVLVHVFVSETSIINPTTYLFLETRRVFLFILDLQKPVFGFHHFRHPRHAVVSGKVGICSCTRSHIFHSGIILICYCPFPTWCACSRPHNINLCKCPFIHGFEDIFLETNVVYFTTMEAIFEEFWLLWRIFWRHGDTITRFQAVRVLWRADLEVLIFAEKRVFVLRSPKKNSRLQVRWDVSARRKTTRYFQWVFALPSRPPEVNGACFDAW